MFENSDAVSFATNGTATYHYPNPAPSTIGPFGSGATLKTDGEKIVGRVEARGATALMEWLGKYMPSAQKHARSFACMTDFRVYMASVTGVTQEYFDSHDDACTAYLEALMRKQPASMTPTLDKLEAQAAPNAQMLVNDRRQPTARERSVMARINLAKSLAADWEAAKKQPALAHPYPFARNFQG